MTFEKPTLVLFGWYTCKNINSTCERFSYNTSEKEMGRFSQILSLSMTSFGIIIDKNCTESNGLLINLPNNSPLFRQSIRLPHLPYFKYCQQIGIHTNQPK